MTKEQFELNDGHLVEAMDRLAVAQQYLDEVVASHPILYSVPEYWERTQKSIELLGALYQDIGKYEAIEEFFESEKTKPNYLPRPRK